MLDLPEHYAQLLGLDDSWRVGEVDLSIEDNRVTIHLQPVSGQPRFCAECKTVRPLKDHAPVRKWRHLDTMQFQTVLVARTPRTKCPECGVKTCTVPWASPHGRFTLMFEAFAIKVLQIASSVDSARSLLHLSWDAVHRILEQAVERGLKVRDLDGVTRLCIDEKSFRRRQSYVTVLTDHDNNRVLEVVENRTKLATDGLWSIFDDGQKENIEAVAMDMWLAFENSVLSNLANAEIVHDRFHIMKHLNDAVDQVRRSEHKELKTEGDETLTGSKYLWLSNPENITDERWDEFKALKEMHLKTARAWAIREQFNFFWDYEYAGWARKFFKQWYGWASRCQLEPVRKKAKMIKNHLENILTYFEHRISNGPAEGFNSRIQSVKSAARGFRNFENYRTRILFFCGRLDLMPNGQSH